MPTHPLLFNPPPPPTTIWNSRVIDLIGVILPCHTDNHFIISISSVLESRYLKILLELMLWYNGSTGMSHTREPFNEYCNSEDRCKHK